MYHDPPKMASLASLPEELIIHIITNSGLKSRALYNLGQVNKYFSIRALAHIYHHVELRWVLNGPSTTLSLFHDIIDTFPERALLVRSIDITCDMISSVRADLFFEHYFHIDRLLGKLRSIQELYVTSPRSLYWFPDWLHMNPALALTHVRLLYPFGVLLDIREYLFHPNLEYLEVTELPSFVKLTGDTTSQLRRLRFKTRGFCDSAVEVLKCCKSLTEFTCVVLGGHSDISPAKISISLLLVGQNITTLNLTTKNELPVDNSMLHLRSHKALRELSVHCNLLFGNEACFHPPKRCGLSERLPPSLECLKV